MTNEENFYEPQESGTVLGRPINLESIVADEYKVETGKPERIEITTGQVGIDPLDLILRRQPKHERVRVSPTHGRATALKGEAEPVIDPENGVAFSAVDFKGADMNHLKVERTEFARGGFKVHGLFELDLLATLTSASRYLLKNGLPVEKVIRAWELEQVKAWGRTLSLQDWKTEYVNRMNPGEQRDEVETYLKDTRFAVVQRGLQISERISDLTLCKTRQGFEKMTGRVFNFVNGVFDRTGQGVIPGTPASENFDIKSRTDVERYFCRWLPSQMGRYMGELRRHNFYMGFSHAQNFLAVGTRVDADSSESDEIGNPPRADMEVHYCDDFGKSLGALYEIFRPEHVGRPKGYLAGLFNPADFNVAVGNFVSSYARGVWPEKPLASVRNYLQEYGGYVDGFTYAKPVQYHISNEAWEEAIRAERSGEHVGGSRMR